MAPKTDLIPSADAIARCVHAQQAVTFVARRSRRMRSDPTVLFVLVPLAGLQHAEDSGFAMGEWLVWQNHTGQGVVGRLPSAGGAIAEAIATPNQEGQLARWAIQEVMDAVWRTITE